MVDHARGRQGRRPMRAGSEPLLIVCGYFIVLTAATALLCVTINVISAVQFFRAGSDVRASARSSAAFPFASRPKPTHLHGGAHAGAQSSDVKRRRVPDPCRGSRFHL